MTFLMKLRICDPPMPCRVHVEPTLDGYTVDSITLGRAQITGYTLTMEEEVNLAEMVRRELKGVGA